jgi:beta-N-acetylhexosaminidase
MRPALFALRWSALLLALFVVGCADRAPSTAPDIVGQITRATTSVVDGSRRINILVEAVPNDLSGSPKALVTVDRSTRILHANANISARVEDLLPGATVSVWFDGPVAESYPVQARAGTLLIMTNAESRPASATSLTDPLTRAYASPNRLRNAAIVPSMVRW